MSQSRRRGIALNLCPLVPYSFRSQVEDGSATEIEERKKSFLNSPKFGFHPALSLLAIIFKLIMADCGAGPSCVRTLLGGKLLF